MGTSLASSTEVAQLCLAAWNRTHKAAVGKQVTIKRNPFEMSGFAFQLPSR